MRNALQIFKRCPFRIWQMFVVISINPLIMPLLFAPIHCHFVTPLYNVTVSLNKLQVNKYFFCPKIIGSSNPFREKIFSLFLMSTQTRSPLLNGCMGCVPRRKSLAVHSDLSPPSSSEVKNEWSHIFIFLYALVVCTGRHLSLLTENQDIPSVCLSTSNYVS